jgi:hypothetical protein
MHLCQFARDDFDGTPGGYSIGRPAEVERHADSCAYDEDSVEAKRSGSVFCLISNLTHLARVGSRFGSEIDVAPSHLLDAKESIDLDIGSEPVEELGGVASGNDSDDSVSGSKLLEKPPYGGVGCGLLGSFDDLSQRPVVIEEQAGSVGMIEDVGQLAFKH